MHNATSVRKLLLIWTLSMLPLCSVGYLYYSYWQQKVNQSNTIPYILRSSAVVIDIPALGKACKEFQKTAIGQSLQTFEPSSYLHETWTWLRQMAKENSLQEDFPVVIAIQSLHKGVIGCVLYLDLQIPAVAKLIERLESNQNRKKSTNEVRNYAGYTITAIHGSESKSSKGLYLLKQSHYAILSLSELLLEDIIRGLAQKQKDTFFCLRKSAGKQGSVFINFQELPPLLSIFLKEESCAILSTQIVNMLSQTQLEIKFTDHYLLLQGAGSKEQPLFNDCHWLPKIPAAKNKNPHTLHAYIPISTAILEHYLIHDPIQCVQQLVKDRDPLKQIMESPNNPFASLDSYIKNEVALCTLGTADKQQLLFIALRNKEQYLNILQKCIDLQYHPAHQIPHFSTIYTINLGSLAYTLPQMLFPNFTPRLLSTVDNYLVLANSLEALQALEKAYLEGSTWARKENKPHQILSNITEQATLNLFMDLKVAHQWILQHLKPVWGISFEKNIGKFLENGYLGIQLGRDQTSGTGGGYIQGFLAQLSEPEEVPKALPKRSHIEVTKPSHIFFKTDNPIQTGPILVETHKPEGNLLLLQDKANHLYLVRPSGELIWKKKLDGPLLNDVFVVDIYKNKKWQYLCATAHSLYIIDYTGNEVAPFPRTMLTKGRAIGINIIDYEKDKNYRILIADEEGNIYLKDSQYRPLPGWNPNPLTKSFVATPMHLRVDKDYFIALQEAGTLYLMNRRGQNYPGFPIHIGELVHNPPIIQRGKQAHDTHIVILTETGKVNTYTLSGALKNSIQLSTQGPTDKFTLVPSAIDSQAYIILQQTIDKIIVLHPTGEVLFEKPCEANQALIGQYYNHGIYPLYVITHVEQEKTYIYDEKGNLLHQPLPNSGYPVELFWTSPTQQLTVYTTFGNEISKYQVDIANSNFVSEDLYE